MDKQKNRKTTGERKIATYRKTENNRKSADVKYLCNGDGGGLKENIWRRRKSTLKLFKSHKNNFKVTT